MHGQQILKFSINILQQYNMLIQISQWYNYDYILLTVKLAFPIWIMSHVHYKCVIKHLCYVLEINFYILKPWRNVQTQDKKYETSPWIYVNQAVRKGCNPSSALFNMYIEDLLRNWKHKADAGKMFKETSTLTHSSSQTTK